MDQVKTGKFIALSRRAKHLTQRAVADRLLISEKTVSKWETGNGMPDVSLMLPLCELLGITVNELLSGERPDESSRFEKAEENILSLGEQAGMSRECLKKALRRFSVRDADILQKFYCPELSVEAIKNMICEWNTLNFKGRYFEMFAVVIKGAVVGTLSIYEHSKSVASLGPDIFGEYRGRGYAKIAMTRGAEIAREKGFGMLCQQVAADNKESIDLHASLGFETDNYIYKNRRGVDCLLFFMPL